MTETKPTNQSDTAHSPLPWKLDKAPASCDSDLCRCVVDSDGDAIMEFHACGLPWVITEKDIPFIVRCVNSGEKADELVDLILCQDADPIKAPFQREKKIKKLARQYQAMQS